MLTVQPFQHRGTTEHGRGVFRRNVPIKAIENAHAKNTEFPPKNLTSPLFARVLFARTIQAHWGNFDDQSTAAGYIARSGRRNFVQSWRQHRGRNPRVHLYTVCVAKLPGPLSISPAFCILWVGIAIVTPVVGVAFLPNALSLSLVAPVIRIRLQLTLLPLTFPGALACRR